MQDKFYIILAYALFGIAIGLWPLYVTEKGGWSTGDLLSSPKRRVAATWLTAIVLLIAALGTMAITGESVLSPLILTFGLAAIATATAGGRFDALAMLAGFFALCVSVTLLWWTRHGRSLDVSIYQLVVFFLIVVAFIWIFASRSAARETGIPARWIIAYTGFAAFLTFSTGIFDENHFAFRLLWLHWGAYVGPAELLLSGAAIFHDFPAQYGLGPTALIAGVCGKDCWHGMYFVAGFATFAYSVLLAVLALALTRKRLLERLAIFALCLATSYLWAGFPPHLSTPMTTPSVSGLRFLPATLLLTYLFFAGEIERSKRKILVAQALWAFGVLWSPESAFYVTFLWWPYYVFVRREHGDLFSRVKGLVKAGLVLLAAAVVLAIVFEGVYRLIYREGPTLYGILAYAIDPPGPLPINWHGAVWYFLLATLAGLGALLYAWRKTGDTAAFRRGFLLQLACYGAFSYFLGRSHDNNILNIIPFVMLVLLNVISMAESRVLSRIGIVLAAALLGWLPTFAWQPWDANVMQGEVLTFDSRIDERLALEQPGSGLAADARKAIEYISQHYGEPVTLLDGSFDLIRSTPPDPWSALHGPENFAFMPSDRRREFLSRTAASLKRAGWVVVAQNFPADEWLADFDSVYQRTERLEFGRYYAIRYSPKIQ